MSNIINDAWLNLGDDFNEELIFNPMEFAFKKCGGDITKTDIYTAWLMTRPEYFYFICKYVFNVEISPLQSLLLADMWNRKFPMVVGSRGMSKALEPECPVLTPSGWVEIQNLQVGDTVYGSDGKETKVISTSGRLTNLKFYKITLRDGRTINACEDHMWKVWSKNKNRGKNSKPVWSEMKTSELVDSYYYDRIDSKAKDGSRTKEFLYALPINRHIDFPKANLTIHPYILGVLLGDGSITHKTISFTSADHDIAQRVEDKLPPGYKLNRRNKGNYSVYTFSRSDKSVRPFRYLLQDLGLNGKCSHNKFIPTEYLFSSYAQRMELLKGLMDTDGTASNGNISYTTVSKKLNDGFGDLVRSLGLHCKSKSFKSFLNRRQYTDNYLTRIYTNVNVFHLARKSAEINKYKSKAGESKYEKVFITNIEEIPNRDGHCIQVDNRDHTYITKDFIVTHNSFTLSLYAMLRAFLLPARKIVVVGAAFRQSKVLYEYCDTIWKNAPVLRDVCDNNSGLSKDVDRCTVKLNDGIVIFLPLGDGCLTANTSIMLGDRFARLGDLFDSKVKEEYDIPNFSPLLVWDGSGFKNSPFKRSNGLKPTIKLTTKMGYSIEGTLNHKLMSFSGWKQLKDFSKGDLLQISLNETWHSGKTDLTHSEAFNLGRTMEHCEIPDIILRSTKEVVRSFLQGVFFEDDIYTFNQRGDNGGAALQNIISHFGQLATLESGKISLISARPPRDQPFYDEIVSIEYGNDYTYDIEVDESHRYIANCIVSHNSKIRGQRAHDIINDEMASTPKDIFENVVAGFGAVASSPIEKMKRRAAEAAALRFGIELEDEDDNGLMEFSKSNQIILSGTAYYKFNHFAEYHERYSAIIKSGGNRAKLEEIFKGDIPDDFDWRHYAIYRIPVKLLPPGYMDEGQIARSKATVHSGIFDMEYGAVFTTDSKGFFKRSLIESCVCSDKKPIVLPSGEVFFNATTKGNPGCKYVIGVDPASEDDNFSIVVLELHEDHRRVVYTWTTTKERYIEARKVNPANEDNFYSYCARKIRNLMKVFPTVEIAMDALGGGVAVMEAFHEQDKLEPGELPLWPVIDPDKPADTDGEPGLHIVRLCYFVRAEWTSEANHGMRKDFEDKVLLFPHFDSISLEMSLIEDEKSNRIFDTLEDCVFEIEKLKDEVALIVVKLTDSGREKWDTPHNGFSAKTKGKIKKDRYSALLMANDVARRMGFQKTGIVYESSYYNSVGFAKKYSSKDSGNDHFSGPSWFTEIANDAY